jgi:hypothetical protein
VTSTKEILPFVCKGFAILESGKVKLSGVCGVDAWGTRSLVINEDKLMDAEHIAGELLGKGINRTPETRHS